MSGGRIVALGDSCISVQFAAIIDPAVNAGCIALAGSLEALHIRGIRDVVPTYNAVTVHFDPIETTRASLTARVEQLIAEAAVAPVEASRSVEIPVAYGGPDLEAVAAFAGCSEDEVIRLHMEPRYRVYMLGFLPGFAYMGSVNRRIAIPRLDTPRAHVASGSVGIAGEQTGIYPCDSPGGWRVIGRTPAALFDEARAEPFLLRAGDHVTFVAV
jgi:inhibitor of KinA